jgi:hypothetical protein
MYELPNKELKIIGLRKLNEFKDNSTESGKQ